MNKQESEKLLDEYSFLSYWLLKHGNDHPSEYEPKVARQKQIRNILLASLTRPQAPKIEPVEILD